MVARVTHLDTDREAAYFDFIKTLMLCSRSVELMLP